jgi:hypothetical protein
MKRHEYTVWFGRDYLLLVRENERSTGWKVTEPFSERVYRNHVL